MLIGTFIVGIVTVAALSANFPIQYLIIWLLMLLATILYRWFILKGYTIENIDLSNYRKHLYWFTFLSFVNGFSWSSAAFIFYDPNAIIYSIYLICVSLGYISIAGATTSIYMPAFFVFAITIVAVLFNTFFFIGEGEAYNTIAFSLIYYLVTILVFTRFNENNFISAKRLEYENKSLLTQVTEQKNLAENAVVAKNHFLAATSHDLRQPLHAMNLYIDVLHSRLTDPVNVDILEKIKLSGGALTDLLHGLLDISRLDASVIENRPQHIKLTQFIKPFENEFSPETVEPNLTFNIDIDEQHIAYVDPILFERILRNLLSNAFKYTQKGDIQLRSTVVNSKLIISVIDTGIGVPEEKLSSIFSEFVQIDNPERDRSKGLGLGLSIVKRLCDLQNIEMIFNSQLGKGTQVHLTLEQGEAALMPIVPVTIYSSFKYLNILCIDDEKSVRDGIEMLIHSWKCKPIIADDGANALDAIRKLNSKIDIIISDLRLRNEESGISVIESIREELNEDVPAIIITGDTAVDRIELVRDAKRIVLLHKPIQPKDLRKKIESLLKESEYI